MKFIKSSLLSLAIIFGFGLLFLFVSPSEVHARGLSIGCYTFGDVNNDGLITQADSDQVLQYVVNNDISILTAPKLRADVNDNGVVDQTDSTLILQYKDNIISSFPVCTTP